MRKIKVCLIPEKFFDKIYLVSKLELNFFLIQIIFFFIYNVELKYSFLHNYELFSYPALNFNFFLTHNLVFSHTT